jgi:hypothetical protein
MKRVSMVLLALVACIAVGAVTMATAKTKVKTKVSVHFSGKSTSGNSPYTQGTFEGHFAGKVKGKKGCKKNRKVRITPGIGSTKSDNTGNYDVKVTTKPAAGNYTATVKKKKFTKGGEKIVCTKATDTIHLG